MTNEFLARIIKERTVDTARYRYIAKEQHDADSQWLEILRLPLDQLDTTAAIDGWEKVKVIR